MQAQQNLTPATRGEVSVRDFHHVKKKKTLPFLASSLVFGKLRLFSGEWHGSIIFTFSSFVLYFPLVLLFTSNIIFTRILVNLC